MKILAIRFARLGDVIRFIPYPVTVGFTTGIALIIAAGQVGDALGLATAPGEAGPLSRLALYARDAASLASLASSSARRSLCVRCGRTSLTTTSRTTPSASVERAR